MAIQEVKLKGGGLHELRMRGSCDVAVHAYCLRNTTSLGIHAFCTLKYFSLLRDSIISSGFVLKQRRIGHIMNIP